MKALITESFHPILQERLSSMGYAVDLQVSIDYDSLLDVVEDYTLLVVNSKIRIDRILLAVAKNLKIVGRIGSGRDIFDEEACAEYGILTLTSPEGNANAVAEHILGMILANYNHLASAQESILFGQWNREQYRGRELMGKTWAIIGYGHNGRRLADLLSGFGVNILAHDTDPTLSYASHVKPSDMHEIFSEADIVSMHLPLTGETTGYVSMDWLQSFHKQIDFINTSRGAVAPWESILYGLDSGKIRTAMLDVFEEEPIIDTSHILPWIYEKKLFLTPHIAGWTEESKMKLATVLADKIEKNTNPS